MTDTIFKYPLDLLGTSPTNKVIDEAHTIGLTRGRIFPSNYGPFFGSSVTVVDAVTGKELVPNDQYVLVHYYSEASNRTGQAVYAAVRITDPDVATEILFTAQMVGGEFSYSTYAIIQAIEGLIDDDRPVAWGDLIGVPSMYNPTPHTHSIYETYRWEHMIWATNDVAAAIREGDTASRNLLVSQVQAKLDEFGDTLSTEIASIRRELNYVKVYQDTVLEINRRYLIMRDGIKLTAPSVTGAVSDGDWVMIQCILGVEPYIVSNDKSIKCINGTDTTQQGVLINDVHQRLLVWEGIGAKWVI